MVTTDGREMVTIDGHAPCPQPAPGRKKNPIHPRLFLKTMVTTDGREMVTTDGPDMVAGDDPAVAGHLPAPARPGGEKA